MEVHQLWEGDLNGSRSHEVRQHLAQCHLCQAEVERWDRISGLLARGDLAEPLAPERRQQMKETLLEQCGAALQESGDAPGRQIAPVFWPWRWGMAARMGLGMAALVVVGLLWFASGGPQPGAPVSTVAGTPPRPSGPQSPPKAPRSPQVAFAPGQGDQMPAGPHPLPPLPSLGEGGRKPVRSPGTPLPGVGRGAGGEGRSRDQTMRNAEPPAPPRLVVSRRAEKRLLRPRRIKREGWMRAAPRERRQKPASGQLMAAVPYGEQTAPAPGMSGAAPKPIERIVIQVDEPPVRPVEVVTRITVIASGDLKSPGATLTVVKTQREETLP
jgi:hypothetical protein